MYLMERSYPSRCRNELDFELLPRSFEKYYPTEAFAQNVLNDPPCILSPSSKRYGSPGEIRTPVDGSLPGFVVQSPSLAGSLFSTLASPLHHRATRDPGLRPRPNKPSAQSTTLDLSSFLG